MRDNQVAADGETNAAAEGKAADGATTGFSMKADGAHYSRRLGLMRAHLRDVHHRQFLEVAAGAEAGRCRGKNDRGDTIVAVEFSEGIAETHASVRCPARCAGFVVAEPRCRLNCSAIERPFWHSTFSVTPCFGSAARNPVAICSVRSPRSNDRRTESVAIRRHLPERLHEAGGAVLRLS